jgi:hypothetical protein
MKKPMREYQRDWRERNRPRQDGKPRRSILSDMQIIIGWVAGRISEESAVRLLGIDRLEARRLRDEAVTEAERQWKEFRGNNPVSV